MNTKKRVVAYARVSTNKNDQTNSLENQKTFFQRKLENNSEYVLVRQNIPGICFDGIYADKGVSGTKLSRPAFDRMLKDAGLEPIIDADTEEKTTTYKIARKPNFDIIFVKDTSRFSRNVSVNAILQTLKDNGVYVYFLDLNKTTASAEDVTVIQLFFSLAERESRDRSKKVSFGYEEGTRKGKIYFGGKMIGYDYHPDTNTLTANKDADLVRLVFDMYTEQGLGQQRICNKLAELGYYNSAGHKYSRSTIKRMLENEKYCGVTNTGRYHKPDLFSQKRVVRDYNDTLRIEAREAQEKLLEQGIVKIERIISKEQFQKAQEITRANCKKYNNDCTYHGISDYARKIKCGCCGGWYTAQSRKYSVGSKKMIRYYACQHRFAYDEAHGIPKCNNPSIREDVLDNLINSEKYYSERLKVITEFMNMGKSYIETLRENINSDNEEVVKSLQKKIETLTGKRNRNKELYIDGRSTKEEFKKIDDELTDQINQANIMIDELSQGNNLLYKRIAEIDRITQEAEGEYKTIERYVKTQSYPRETRRSLLRDVECITIDTKGEPHIEFKSLSAIYTATMNMWANINRYSELDEEGWKEEQQQAENWEEEHGELYSANTEHETLKQVMDKYSEKKKNE